MFITLSLTLALVGPATIGPTQPGRIVNSPAHQTQTTATESTDCRTSLLSAVHLLRLTPAKRVVAHLQFTSHTYFRTPEHGKIREVATSANLYTNGRQVYFYTPQTVMWQDGQYSAIVMHSQKTIYLTRTPPQGNSPAVAQFAMLQDSLIQRAQILQCQTVKETGGTYQKMVLNLAPRDRAHYGITTLGFKLNGRGSIRELTIIHPPGDLITQVVYAIDKQEFMTSSLKLPNDARAKVVNEKNQPVSIYQGYQVVDQTKLSR